MSGSFYFWFNFPKVYHRRDHFELVLMRREDLIGMPVKSNGEVIGVIVEAQDEIDRFHCKVSMPSAHDVGIKESY
jgi:hypothetical protein